MNTKHTPGPWVLDETWGLIVASDGTEIAACHSGIKANARLIAVAPEMLEVLKRCLNDGAGNLEPETVHLAMEAIKKAEGRK